MLVVGGTVPRLSPSLARSVDQLAEQLGGPPLADLAGAADQAGAATAAISLTGITVQGSLTGAAAMTHLVAAWEAADKAGDGLRSWSPSGPPKPTLSTPPPGWRGRAGPATVPGRRAHLRPTGTHNR